MLARFQGGISVLLPAGFIDSEVAKAGVDCDEAVTAGMACTVESGVFPAPTYGAGFGLLWKSEGTRVRLDAHYQAQTTLLYRQTATNDSGSIDATVRLVQSRLLLLLGVEL